MTPSRASISTPGNGAERPPVAAGRDERQLGGAVVLDEFDAVAAGPVGQPGGQRSAADDGLPDGVSAVVTEQRVQGGRHAVHHRRRRRRRRSGSRPPTACGSRRADACCACSGPVSATMSSPSMPVISVNGANETRQDSQVRAITRGRPVEPEVVSSSCGARGQRGRPAARHVPGRRPAPGGRRPSPHSRRPGWTSGSMSLTTSTSAGPRSAASGSAVQRRRPLRRSRRRAAA